MNRLGSVVAVGVFLTVVRAVVYVGATPAPDPVLLRLTAVEANVARTDSLLIDLADRLAAHDSTMADMFDYWMTETW